MYRAWDYPPEIFFFVFLVKRFGASISCSVSSGLLALLGIQLNVAGFLPDLTSLLLSELGLMSQSYGMSIGILLIVVSTIL